jgi:hypothetical protein
MLDDDNFLNKFISLLRALRPLFLNAIYFTKAFTATKVSSFLLCARYTLAKLPLPIFLIGL